MATIEMIPISEEQATGLEITDTGVSMLGLGGHDYKCGHCRRLMIQAMDLDKVKVVMAYRCGRCGGLSLVPGQG